MRDGSATCDGCASTCAASMPLGSVAPALPSAFDVATDALDEFASAPAAGTGDGDGMAGAVNAPVPTGVTPGYEEGVGCVVAVVSMPATPVVVAAGASAAAMALLAAPAAGAAALPLRPAADWPALPLLAGDGLDLAASVPLLSVVPGPPLGLGLALADALLPAGLRSVAPPLPALLPLVADPGAALLPVRVLLGLAGLLPGVWPAELS